MCMEDIWIGANDKAQEEQWSWVPDNSLLDYNDWYWGQSDDADGEEEDCATLWKTHAYQWNSKRCVEQCFNICEKQIDVSGFY